jgi:excisionase family DNA binding protein
MRISAQEAAKLLRVSENTVREWARSGRLSGTKGTRGWQFDRWDIERVRRELAARELAGGHGLRTSKPLPRPSPKPKKPFSGRYN